MMFGKMPYNAGAMATVTIRELGRQVSSVVKEVEATKRPTFVTHRGTPVAVLLPVDTDELEDYVLANAPEYVASIAAADEAIERGEPGASLSDVITEFETEHGPLDDKG
jgi:prevent-host-death family protein